MRIYLGLALCLVMVLLGVSGAGAASVTLEWTATGDDGPVGQATVYDLRYSLSTITDANWASATKVTGLPVPKVSGSAETFTVTGLVQNTVYYFALKVGDEAANWSALSNVAQKSTAQETIAPAAIANLSTGTVTSASVVLTWTAPGDDAFTGTATTYDLRYSTSAITSANWASATQVTGEPAPEIAGSPEAFTVTGLSSSTTYYFAIETADEVPNWSTLSNVISVWISTMACCTGCVGDANGDGNPEPTIGDVASLIDARFMTGTHDGILACLKEADVNQSGGADPTFEDISLADISILIDYLYTHGPYDPIYNPEGIQLPECL